VFSVLSQFRGSPVQRHRSPHSVTTRLRESLQAPTSTSSTTPPRHLAPLLPHSLHRLSRRCSPRRRPPAPLSWHRTSWAPWLPLLGSGVWRCWLLGSLASLLRLAASHGSSGLLLAATLGLWVYAWSGSSLRVCAIRCPPEAVLSPSLKPAISSASSAAAPLLLPRRAATLCFPATPALPQLKPAPAACQRSHTAASCSQSTFTILSPLVPLPPPLSSAAVMPSLGGNSRARTEPATAVLQVTGLCLCILPQVQCTFVCKHSLLQPSPPWLHPLDLRHHTTPAATLQPPLHHFACCSTSSCYVTSSRWHTTAALLSFNC
jgi:hypothetical protein